MQTQHSILYYTFSTMFLTVCFSPYGNPINVFISAYCVMLNAINSIKLGCHVSHILHLATVPHSFCDVLIPTMGVVMMYDSSSSHGQSLYFIKISFLRHVTCIMHSYCLGFIFCCVTKILSGDSFLFQARIHCIQFSSKVDKASLLSVWYIPQSSEICATFWQSATEWGILSLYFQAFRLT